MNQTATQRAVGSRVKAKPSLSLPRNLLMYVGYLGRIVGVLDDENGLRYAVAFGNGKIEYFTDEQLAKGVI